MKNRGKIFLTILFSILIIAGGIYFITHSIRMALMSLILVALLDLLIIPKILGGKKKDSIDDKRDEE